jgi:uncharacterized protein DUF6438
MRRCLGAGLLWSALFACHAPAPAPAPAERAAAADIGAAPAVTLERTSCFGTCPVYRVSISRSGLVRFEGKKHVARAGADTSRVSKGSVDSLLAELEGAGYFDFDDRYVAGARACGLYATDLPTVVTEVTDSTRSRRIEHDRGCSAAPPELSRLENRIDEVAGTARWTGR